MFSSVSQFLGLASDVDHTDVNVEMASSSPTLNSQRTWGTTMDQPLRWSMTRNSGWVLYITCSPKHSRVWFWVYAFPFQGEPNLYDYSFHCLPCAKGCDMCRDASPCILSQDWVQRSIVLGISCLIMCFIPLLGWFTFKYSDVKVYPSLFL